MRYVIRNIRTNTLDEYQFHQQKDFIKFVGEMFVSWYRISDFAHYRQSSNSVCWASLFIRKADFKKVVRGESVDFFEISHIK